ncbi:MAG: flagellar hook capping FlgD N-terminal domain-containing protein [Phycisphaeraceae bacterium]
MDVMDVMGAGGGGGAAATAKNAFASLDSEEFIKILVTELTTQDPFEPNDSAQVLEQLSSLRNIESQMDLQDQLKNLVLQNQVSQASGLIGKMVQGMDEQNNRIEGVVTSVRVADGQAMLELDTGRRLSMGRVEIIANKPASEATDSFGQLV